MDEAKTCLKCGERKPVEEFYRKSSTQDHRDTRCRTCRCKQIADYRKNNPEKVNAISKRSRTKHAEKAKARSKTWYRNNQEYAKRQMAVRRATNPEKVRCERLRASFGITAEAYDRMLESQLGSCAICGIHHTSLKRKLAVDHCHSTGKVRGLLCGKCNSAIGLVHESTHILRKAINYLNKHSI